MREPIFSNINPVSREATFSSAGATQGRTGQGRARPNSGRAGSSGGMHVFLWEVASGSGCLGT